MTAVGGPPEHAVVVRELMTVREKGLGALRRLRLPALHQAARIADITTNDAEPEPAAVEALIREAVEHLDGGEFQEAAQYTFGLLGGTKYAPSTERRRQAAKSMNVVAETFRKSHEKQIVEQTAEGVLALCRDTAMRRAHLHMEQRHPADSRLAVAWVERFEAYYRIWTPVYALAADLKAALATYHEEPADHLPWDPDSEESFDPVKEAQGYARSALYWYSKFQLEERRFMARHGGLWLLSDAEVEGQVRDAVYRIGWHNPINEENESWLRRKLADSRYEEAEHFYASLSRTATGETVHAIWQRFVLAGAEAEAEAEVGGAKSSSQVHDTMRACEDYIRLVDEDWMKIADWYAPGARAPKGVNGNELYDQLIEANPLAPRG